MNGKILTTSSSIALGTTCSRRKGRRYHAAACIVFCVYLALVETVRKLNKHSQADYFENFLVMEVVRTFSSRFE